MRTKCAGAAGEQRDRLAVGHESTANRSVRVNDACSSVLNKELTDFLQTILAAT